jgi:hypothetical protein
MSFILAFTKNVVDEKPIHEFRNIRVMADAGSENAFPNISDSEFTFTEKFFDGVEWNYSWHNEDRSWYLIFNTDKEYETGEPVIFNYLYVFEEQYVPYENFKNAGDLGGGPSVSNYVSFSTDSNNILSFSDIDGYGGTLQFVDN